MTTAAEDLVRELRAHVGAQGSPQVARHPVTTTAIADWCDAMGVTNPRYLGPYPDLAPPAMLDVWDRPGLPFSRRGDSPRSGVLERLDAEGYVSVVAVNSELEFTAPVRPGDVVKNVETLEDISDEKATGLGVGIFVTTRHRYTSGAGVHVGDLLFRILKFRPGTGKAHDPGASGRTSPDPDPMRRPKPAVNADNQFFWDGVRHHELRLQRCEGCATLHMPPTARCAACGSFELGHAVASGAGTLYSYAVPHFPQVDGFRYPLLVGLVELAEGVRVVANLTGVGRDDLRIGMPLELGWIDADPPLPQFRPAPPAPRETTLAAGDVSVGDRLPPFAVPVTATLIVAGAIATRDFTPVHHDRDLAVARGSKDIFMNINTSIGLVQRYVDDWAGPGADFRAIRVRLGAPNYVGDTMAFSGEVTGAGAGTATVTVRGANSLGDHVTATVELGLP